MEQREDGDSSWDDASCGSADGDNEVDGTECIASGLDSGTGYDFRVRAVPADDDAAHLVSGWSDTAEARTEGTSTGPTTPTTSGGMGALNVRWESTNASITWIWDRVAGAKYDIHSAETAYSDSSNPCEDVPYDPLGSSATSATLSIGVDPGDIALLCVRTTNEDNLSENLSFAWAAAAPAVSAVGDPTEQDKDKDTDDDTTTGLTWDDFRVKGGFDYEWRAVADPVRQDDITEDTDIQSVCGSGVVIETGDSDWDYMVDEIRLTQGLKVHTGYLLCTRYGNTAGASDWTAPTDNAEALTRPGTPPNPTLDNTRVDEGTENTTVAWQIAVRTSSDVPHLPAGFTAKTLVYREKWEDSDDLDSNSQPKVKTTKAPTAADCQAGTGSQDQFLLALVTGDAVKTNSSGFVFISGEIDRPDYPGDSDNDFDNRRVHLCVQAMNETGNGPWRLGSPYRVNQKPKPAE